MSTTSEQIRLAALKFGAKWPLLVVAQWHLESAKGTLVSGKNNFFGLKGTGTIKQTTEYINGNPVRINDNFLNFETPEDCIEYLVTRWYKDWNGYTGINNANSAEDAARMLQSEGYATDPNYASKLIKIMSEYKSAQPSVYANLVDAAEHFTGLPHQVAALNELQASLTKEQHEAFTKRWRSVQGSTANGKPTFPLNVPYYYQRDSKTGHGERMCQSSSIAMRIKQIDQSLIKDDDDYFSIVNRFGDTVSQAAHQHALSYLGLRHQFRQDGDEKTLYALLDKGISVPIGILHKGTVSNPTGGGHWIILIGYDQSTFYCHDPFGELDLINGGYPLTGPLDGKNQRYSITNLMKRWLISSKSDGWLWVIEK